VEEEEGEEEEEEEEIHFDVLSQIPAGEAGLKTY
jgi:hypothetical protein